MNIFITGATGFIGKNLVNKLIDENINVTINLRQGKTSPFGNNVACYYVGEKSIKEDIKFFKTKKFNGIIHLASLYITTHTSEDVNNLIDSNVKFGSYMLECASQAQIPWFINTGTFWQHYQDKEYSPVNLYAASKQAFEAIAQYYIDTNKIKFVSLHLSDTYGPNDTRKKIFNIWQQIALTGEALDMSLGEQKIDISHINDIVSAFTLLSKHLYKNDNRISNGDVFATKAAKRYSLKQLSTIFEKTLNCSLNINWGKRDYREREVMIPWNKCNIVPDWSPKVSIGDGIKSLI